MNRNGAISDLAVSYGSYSDTPGQDKSKLSLSTSESLQANDKIYLELYHNSEGSGNINYGVDTWFSGHLVKAF